MSTATKERHTRSTPVSPLAARVAAIRRSVGKFRSLVETHWALATNGTDALLRRRFNRWAKRGWGESLERHHKHMARIILDRLELRSVDRILDLGCGQGWACRLIADRAPHGCIVMGVDMSDEMIRQAREKNESFPNIIYHCAGADSIPVFDNYFTKIISIEAFYYFEQQERVLRELLRVTEAGGQLFLLICTFRGDQKTHSWADEVGLPLHNRSTQEYEQMLRHCGWTDVASRVFDFRSDPATHLGEHDRPLLLIARKRR